MPKIKRNPKMETINKKMYQAMGNILHHLKEPNADKIKLKNELNQLVKMIDATAEVDSMSTEVRIIIKMKMQLSAKRWENLKFIITPSLRYNFEIEEVLSIDKKLSEIMLTNMERILSKQVEYMDNGVYVYTF